jgi:hypothetical protein
MSVLLCANCGEEIEGEPVKRGTRLFCSAACAFEAARSVDCSGRTDVSQTTTPAEEISRPTIPGVGQRQPPAPRQPLDLLKKKEKKE